MKKYTWGLCLLTLMLLFACGCHSDSEETGTDEPTKDVQQEQKAEENTQEESVPTLTVLPTWEERQTFLLQHSKEARQAYDAQIYDLLNQCSPQQVYDGLQQELENWCSTVEGVAFTRVEAEFSQDPLLMWSDGDKRQFRNVTASIRLFYDPSTLEGAEQSVMEPLLEEVQQLIRQSPYGLKLVSGELAFVDETTGYPNYFLNDLGVGTPDGKEPSAPIPPEEQALQTLAYETISAFCQQTFTGEPFTSLPYANMTLSRFGVEEGSPALVCEVRIQYSSTEDAQTLAQQLEGLAQQLADQWMGEGQALGSLGVTTCQITFDLRDSPNDLLVFDFPLGAV